MEAESCLAKTLYDQPFKIEWMKCTLGMKFYSNHIEKGILLLCTTTYKHIYSNKRARVLTYQTN